jgi:hypothetical protein
MSNPRISRLVLFSVVLVSNALVGCNQEHSFDKMPVQRFAQMAPPASGDPGTPGTLGGKPKPDTVCDPFSNPVGGTGTTSANGLNARLYYVPMGMGPGSALEYPKAGTLVEAEIFFSQLNVPTRPFTAGFATSSGGALKTKDGDTLVEYFGLQFESRVGLAPGEEPGLYQFAVLSDDGSVLQVKPSADGAFETLIDNDGDHPTRMECAGRAVQLASDTRMPVQLNYYQGPKWHIALLLMWRKVAPGDASLEEQECGLAGNEYFFDDQTSVPNARYQGLLDRGWKPLSPRNFYLRESSGPNPCVDS